MRLLQKKKERLLKVLKTADKMSVGKQKQLKQLNGRYKKTARELCYIATAVAMMVMCSWLSLLVGGIPFTLQTLGVCLTAGLLGFKRGTVAMCAYVLLGVAGVPVFAGFTGGAAKLLSPTGGYIIGFLAAAPIIGIFADIFAERKSKSSNWLLALGMFLGLCLSYFLGTVWFVLLTIPTNEVMGYWSGFLLCVAPYLPFDIIKIGIAVFLTKRLRKFIKL